jgi:cytoskeletal protein CcmA (bactofilin family)
MSKKDKKSTEITVILGEGSKLTGKFEFDGVSRIDGNFEGEIDSKDTLVVGQTANIKADIRVGILILEGKIEGNVTAKEEILIHPSGKLYGNIQTPALIIEKGGIFEGQSNMNNKKDNIEKIEDLKIKKK